MLVKYIPLLAILSDLAQSGPLWSRQESTPNLDQKLDDISKKYSLPGLIVGIKTTTYSETHAVGVRKLGAPNKIQVTDSFHLGSNTKAMTSTLLATYIDKGKLTWDATLRAALPKFTSELPRIHHNLTIAQIASHRSGFNSLPLLSASILQPLYNMSGPAGRKAMLKAILSQPQNATQGTYLYDNINYILLGAIIDHIDSQKWEKAIQKRVFQPLGMNCGFGVPAQSSESSIDNPIGHSLLSTNSTPTPIAEGPLAQRDYPPAYGPAGTVNCDVESYTRFLQLHMDGAKAWSAAGADVKNPTNKLSISSSSFRRMHTPYPGSGTTYTPGGWIQYNTTDTRAWAGGWTLAHVGSNTMFLATAVVAPFYQRTGGAAFFAATNVGDALDGKSADASEGTSEAIEAFI